jgi:hypothetical protein
MKHGVKVLEGETAGKPDINGSFSSANSPTVASRVKSISFKPFFVSHRQTDDPVSEARCRIVFDASRKTQLFHVHS